MAAANNKPDHNDDADGGHRRIPRSPVAGQFTRLNDADLCYQGSGTLFINNQGKVFTLRVCVFTVCLFKGSLNGDAYCWSGLDNRT